MKYIFTALFLFIISASSANVYANDWGVSSSMYYYRDNSWSINSEEYRRYTNDSELPSALETKCVESCLEWQVPSNYIECVMKCKHK